MVNIYVLDKEFQTVGVIDVYESLLWTDRFYSYGDFELYTAFDPKLLEICKQDYYVYIKESPHMMIIEGIEIESDAEDGNNLRIVGRSLESIIERRIVWTQTVIDNKTPFHTFVKNLLEDTIIDPQPYGGRRENKSRKPSQKAIADDRRIDNFDYVETEDPAIIGLTLVETYYFGESVYEIIKNLLEQDFNKTVGYEVLLDENNRFKFQLYTGIDRSYDQKEYVETIDTVKCSSKTYYEQVSENMYVPTSDVRFIKHKKYYEHKDIFPFVVFSPQFDNVVNSNYIDNIQDMKNVALVAMPEEEVEGAEIPSTSEHHGYRRTIIVGKGKNMDRRELFSDASDLKQEDFESSNEYMIALKDRGRDDLHAHSRVTSYEGEVEATRQFVYGEDFFMGDIIQMANEYGIEGRARIVEWVLSISNDGVKSYPTFYAIPLIDDTSEEEDNL